MFYENRLGPPTGVVCGKFQLVQKESLGEKFLPTEVHGLLMVVVSWDEIVGKDPTDPKPSQDPKPFKQIWGSDDWGVYLLAVAINTMQMVW